MSMVGYWDRGVANVPDITGARSLMDAHDIPELAEALGFLLPLVDVLDVGCGTGRIALHCLGYWGVDIAPSAVAYCKQHGIVADLISGPDDVNRINRSFQWVTCLSVFTHVGAEDRADYLRAFAKRAYRLVVDIVPGDGDGSIELWTARVGEFEGQLLGAGFDVLATTDRDAPEATHVHRYYYAVRGR